jgi:hypothetical protein
MQLAEVDETLIMLSKIDTEIGTEYGKTFAAFYQSRPRGRAVGSDGWIGTDCPIECGKGLGWVADRSEGREGEIHER